MSDPGTLYLVGTPIGNLEDFSPRGRRILSEVSVIVCEDTRRARKLLSAFGIPTPRLLALPGHEERARMEPALQALREGASVAVVTDAGMPVVSDPGAPLVKSAREEGIRVEVVPGPSAVSSALAASGMGGGRFHFLGFLARKGTERSALLESAATWPGSLVIFEAPTRLLRTLQDLKGAFGPSRQLAVCRELTKRYEEVRRGNCDELIAHYEQGEVRGEIVIVVEPGAIAQVSWELPVALAAVEAAVAEGTKLKEACKEVGAISGHSSRLLYQAICAARS